MLATAGSWVGGSGGLGEGQEGGTVTELGSETGCQTDSLIVACYTIHLQFAKDPE